jgi:catechol 2,3-dioxygenase
LSATGVIAATTLGAVQLTVSDRERSRRFYEQALGLRTLGAEDGAALRLGAEDGASLLVLYGDPEAPARDPRRTGLFHFALLVPTRRDLASALARLASAGRQLTGASDHLVSEALYLHDPDGNGVEIYRDRERSEWPRDQAGAIQMATLPLDLDGLLAELGAGLSPGTATDAPLSGTPAGTRMGHIHLQVSELRDSEAFYSGLLGFDVTVRSYPGALFLSFGGYHHRVALNTWNSRGAAPPAPGSVGLRSFELVLPDAAARTQLLQRLDAAGVPSQTDAQGTFVRDPSGNALLLTVAA